VSVRPAPHSPVQSTFPPERSAPARDEPPPGEEELRELAARQAATMRQQAETIGRQAAALTAKDARIAELNAGIRERDQRIAELEAQREDLQRQVFGSRSEKLPPLEEKAEKPAGGKPPAGARRARTRPDSPKNHQGGGRAPLPENLEIVEEIIDLPAGARIGGETKERLKFFRDEISWKLVYVPGRWVRKKYIRRVYVRQAELLAGLLRPVMAPLPPQLLPGSDIDDGFLVHLIVSRYLDHLPWARQEQIVRRSGMEISRRKLCRWSAEVADRLEPLYRLLIELMAKSRSWMADETHVNVLDPERPGKARKAWLWVYLSLAEKVVVFDFNPARNQDSPLKFFPPGVEGDLLTDGFSVYPAVLEKRPGLVHACCWAHARRAAEKALPGGGAIVREILLDIQKLFAIEREAAGTSGAERETLRRTRGVPAILDGLHGKMKTAQEGALPQSRVYKAAAYALGRWSELCVFAQPGKGHVELTTNILENKIRPVALGRRNSLFIGHPKAGKKSAIFYSIFATCKLCGVCPEKYLHWLFPKLAAATTKTITQLTPHHFAGELAAEKAGAGIPEPP
jgi:hypothetical protein